MKKLERRFAKGLELRENNGGMPTIRGYAAVFNSISELIGGWFYEKIEPGFFTGCLQDPDLDVRCLFNHDSNYILARCKPGVVETLSLKEDNEGLLAEFTPADTQTGRDLVANIRSGNIDGMSFAWVTDEDDWSATLKGHPLRVLKRCMRLEDVSPVVYPAYPGTSINIRALNEQDMTSADYRLLYEQRQKSLSSGAAAVVSLDILNREIELLQLDT